MVGFIKMTTPIQSKAGGGDERRCGRERRVGIAVVNRMTQYAKKGNPCPLSEVEEGGRKKA